MTASRVMFGHSAILVYFSDDLVQESESFSFVHVGLVVSVANTETKVGTIAVDGEWQLDQSREIVHEVEGWLALRFLVTTDQQVDVVRIL